MMHKPIHIKNLELSFPHKTCFEGFTCSIQSGDRIAIIGKNGSGKSTLLKIINGKLDPTSGSIQRPDGITFGVVPQVIDHYDTLSGGERLNQAITQALSQQPDVLLLDEPTNHLDRRNRKSLMGMLCRYHGTLIVASHDTELLRTCTNTLWHIHDGRIDIFSGTYDNYIRERQGKKAALENTLSTLKRQKKETHETLMREQQRARKRKVYGEKKYAGDILALRAAQGRGQKTHNKKKASLKTEKEHLIHQLQSLNLPETITPHFSLDARDIGNQTLVHINNGRIGYTHTTWILSRISFTLTGKDRCAIMGDNGSGKSTFVKAIYSW